MSVMTECANVEANDTLITYDKLFIGGNDKIGAEYKEKLASLDGDSLSVDWEYVPEAESADDIVERKKSVLLESILRKYEQNRLRRAAQEHASTVQEAPSAVEGATAPVV